MILFINTGLLLLQIFLTFWIAKRTEKFKDQIKRSEIKFSKFNELQVIALRKIFQLLTHFQSANTLLFVRSKPGSIDHLEFKNLINEWMKRYIECFTELAMEKLLLTPQMKILLSKVISDFEEIKQVLITEKQSLENLEMEYSNNWNYMYSFDQNELDVIAEKLNNLVEKQSVQNSKKHIKELQNEIELLFQKMNETI